MKKVILHVDTLRGKAYGKQFQAGIVLKNDEGYGEGWRLYGPSYAGNSVPVFETELTATDRQQVRKYLDAVDGPLTASDEAIEAAAKAMIGAAPLLHPDEDPEDYQTWDEMSEEDQEICRGLAKATIEAALPLLKYEVQ